MNKKFHDEVLRLMPGVRLVDSYYCFEPIEHILTGFLCDQAPSGTEIWSFTFPLYDRFDFIHLGFSRVLPESFNIVSVEKGREREAAREFTRFVEGYVEPVRCLGDPENFLQNTRVKAQLANPWIRRGYAMTLVLLGRDDEAMEQLEILAGAKYVDKFPHFVEDVTHILNELRGGTKLARQTILRWESASKEKLGL